MNRVALVTGGSRGIGRAIVYELVNAGYSVAVNYVSSDEAAKAIVDELGEDRVLPIRADVSDEREVQAMVEETEATLGPIDVLVNNAGVWLGGLLETVPVEDFRRVLEVSVVGARNCALAVVPGMKERSRGAIVNMSSSVALVGWKGDTAYAAAKSALIGFSLSLAREVAASGVLVNVVVPGLVDTDMTAAIPAKARQSLLDRTFLGRAAEAQEIAALVRFVVKEGTYLTGSVIVADGGLALGNHG